MTAFTGGPDHEHGAPPVAPTELYGVITPQRRVVVADDEALMLRMHQRLLPRLLPPGYKVSTHENGALALAEVDLISADLQQSLGLILSDQMMPEMFGIDFYEAFRQRGHRNVPFLLMSGWMEDGLRERVNQVMAEGDPLFRFLDKPFNNSDLKAVIAELLEIRRRIEGVKDMQ